MRTSLLVLAVALGTLQAGCPGWDFFSLGDDDIGECLDCGFPEDEMVGGDGDADGDADEAISPESEERAAQEANLEVLCNMAAVAFCDGDAACCSDGWTDERRSSCIAGTRAFCDELYGDAVHEGRLSVDVEPIRECFESMREAVATHCPIGGPADLGGSEACGRILVGHVGQGHFCNAQCECQNGLACLFESPGDTIGVCAVAPGEGEACTVVCDTGLWCLDGTCERPRGLRSRCTVSADGTWDDCADGLYCTAAGQCAGRANDGTACDDDRACFGDRCVDGVCTTEPYPYCLTAE